MSIYPSTVKKEPGQCNSERWELDGWILMMDSFFFSLSIFVEICCTKFEISTRYNTIIYWSSYGSGLRCAAKIRPVLGSFAIT